MFSSLPITYIDDLIEKATQRAGPHLCLYNSIYKHICKFIKQHHLLVSRDQSSFSYTYIIYGSHIFQYANMLSNELVSFTPYVRLNTILKNKEFVIEVDGIRMVIFHNIDQSFVKIMSNTSEENKTKLSPDIELIDIYHKLYSPQKYNDWEDLYRYEKRVWAEFNKIRSMIIATPAAKGGGPIDLPGLALEWVKGQDDCVLIGDRAAGLLNKRNSHFTNAIQFISADTETTIEQLKKYMTASAGVELVVKKHGINLPGDFRVSKYIISSKNGGKYVANIYNSAEFELVPYIMKAGFKIGIYPVLLRFLFMDIWFLRTLRFFNIINQNSYVSGFKQILGNVDNVHSSFMKKIKNDEYGSTQFIGTYIDEIVDKKNIVTPFPYWPAKYKNDTGKFRVI
jgi:hypothetical protein